MISPQNKVPAPAMRLPRATPKHRRRVNSLEASSPLPSPSVRPITAPPPMASIDPRPTIRLITGVTMLTADRASVLTKRETTIVSPMVYSPIKTIVTMVGKANFSRETAVKSCLSGWF